MGVGGGGGTPEYFDKPDDVCEMTCHVKRGFTVCVFLGISYKLVSVLFKCVSDVKAEICVTFTDSCSRLRIVCLLGRKTVKPSFFNYFFLLNILIARIVVHQAHSKSYS